MKIRNKKTGEIITIKSEGELALLELIKNSLPNGLNVWEEVKEPLIKDEKIRKAVRAWAYANGVGRVLYMENIYRFSAIDIATSLVVDFGSMLEHSNLEGGFYTIAELCGENEDA